MNVVVNGDPKVVSEATSIADIVRELVPGHERGVAVALNGEVVVKNQWSGTTLSEGDRLEVLRAIGGG